jgi:pilus assembly protein TadC
VTASAWVAALMTGAAVWSAGRPGSSELRGFPIPWVAPGVQGRARPEAASVLARRLAGVTAGVAAMVVVGGGLGVPVGLVVAVVAVRALGRLGTRADARRLALLHRDLPLVADLLAAALAAGAPPAAAAAAVGRAVGGPLGSELERVARASDLGAAPAIAWSVLLGDPATATLARPVVRAAERGSPAAATAARVGAELRREARDRAAAAAEVVAVRGVGPLGLCFLPAFVLLGVVPLVAGSALALLRP